MIIIGDISGIQTHLFDVSEAGGAQARQLRSRSFFMQMLVEIAALRVLQAAGWKPEENLIFSGAGKFILQGDQLNDAQIERVKKEIAGLNRWLLREVSASLRFSVAVSFKGATEADEYNDAAKKLLRAKKQAWFDVAAENGKWNLQNLILAPVADVCDFCRRRTSFDSERDDETGEMRRICFICRQDREIGKRLPNARYALVSPNESAGEHKIGGWWVRLSENFPTMENGAVVFSLEGEKGEGVLTRRLARHIPTRERKPIEFIKIADGAKGDRLLGVLKMDGDSLGRHFGKLLNESGNLQSFKNVAENLDEFFAVQLTKEIKTDAWKNSIYTVFAGGDDLLLVGAWDKIFEFAGRIQQMFEEKFGSQGLTISGGLAFIKPKRPIRFAAAEAERLLEKAKTKAAFGESEAKNQLAVFGQIWKWRHHSEILQTAKQIVQWIDAGEFRRGWLNTLLRLAEMRGQMSSDKDSAIEEIFDKTLSDKEKMKRRNAQLAASRLAYFVARNFPKVQYRNQTASDIRLWANNLIADFERQSSTDTIYLPAIARYALTATRIVSKEDEE